MQKAYERREIQHTQYYYVEQHVHIPFDHVELGIYNINLHEACLSGFTFVELTSSQYPGFGLKWKYAL